MANRNGTQSSPITLTMLSKIEGSLTKLREDLAEQAKAQRAELDRISGIATNAHAGLGKVESQMGEVKTQVEAQGKVVSTLEINDKTRQATLDAQTKALSDLQAQVTKGLGVEVKKTWKDHAKTVAKVTGLCVLAAASGAGGAYLMREGDETFEAMPVNG